MHESCEYWSGTGECDKTPDYMLVYCKKSCNVCKDVQGRKLIIRSFLRSVLIMMRTVRVGQVTESVRMAKHASN